MKKRSLSLLVVLYCMPSNISAQNSEAYVNAFEAEKAVWTYINCLHCSPEYRSINKTIIHGDTVIDGANWKKITEDLWGDFMAGFVRTSGKKVLFKPNSEQSYGISEEWFNDPYNTTDSIAVYDFSLEAGDMARGHGGYPGKVEEIDSIVLNDGHKHKRMGGGCVEGLGFTTIPPFFHLFPLTTGHWGLDCDLVCCHVNDELLYVNPEYLDSYEDILTGILAGNERIESGPFKIFADNGVLHVYYAESRFDVALFNMNGMIVSRQKDSFGKAVIPLSNLNRGVYTVHIVSGNKSYSQKVYIK